jgi:tetratricopeptide (TPR) repeat protein
VTDAPRRPQDDEPADAQTRELLAEVERLQAGGDDAGAVELLETRFPQQSPDLATWRMVEPLLAPARAAVERLAEADAVTPAALRLLVRGGEQQTERGDFADAERWFDLYDRVRRAVAPDDPVHGAAARAQAELMMELEAHRSARALLESTLALDIRERGADDRTVALDRIRLSFACFHLDDLEAARAHAEQAIAALDALGPPDREAAYARRRLAVVLSKLGEQEAAIELLGDASAIVEQTYGAESADAATTHAVLGHVLSRGGDLGGAQREYERALALTEATRGPDQLDVGHSYHNLGHVLMLLRDRRAAAARLERALAICSQVLPPDHSVLWNQHRQLAEAYEWLEEPHEARRHREWALEWVGSTRGMLDPHYARALADLGGVLIMLGEREAGIEAQRQAVQAHTRAKGADDPGLAHLLRTLAAFEWGADAPAAAVAAWTRAIELGSGDGRDADAGEDGGEEDADDRGRRAVVASMDRLRLAHALSVMSVQQVRAAAALGHGEEAAAALVAVAADALDQMRTDVLRYEDPLDLTTAAYTLIATRSPAQARTALERATEAVGRSDAGGDTDAARIVARAWGALAGALRMAGDRDGVLAAVTQQAEVAASVHGAGAVELLAVSRACSGLRDDDGALGSCRKAVEIAREHDDPLLERTLDRLGDLLLARGERDAAYVAYEERLAVLRALEQEPYVVYQQGVVLHDLAMLDGGRDDLERAIERFRAAVERKRAGVAAGVTFDADSDIAATVVSLARVLTMQSRAGESGVPLSESLRVLEEHLATLDEHPDANARARALTLCDLGMALWQEGRHGQAVGALREAVVAFQLADSLDDVASTLLLLGDALASRQAFEHAHGAYRRRLALLESFAERRRPLDEGVTLDKIAEMEWRLRELPAAIEHYREALVRKDAGAAPVTGPGSLAHTLLPLGRVLVAADRLDEAMDVFQERLSLLESLPEPNPILEGVTLHDIAAVHRRRGEHAEAVECFRRAVERKREGDPEGQRLRDLAATLEALAASLRDGDAPGTVAEADELKAEATALNARAEAQQEG